MTKINTNGILFFAKMILSLNETEGKEKTLETLAKNSDLFAGLLDATHVDISGSVQEQLPIVNTEWAGDKTQEYVRKLKLTELQATIIKIVLKNKNKVSLTKLEKEFNKKGIEMTTGSMVGGSIAGLSKKCVRHNIPMVLENVKQGGDIYYSVVSGATENIQSFIN